MKPKFNEDQYVFIHEIKKFFDMIIENINNPVTTQKEYFKSEFKKDLRKYNKRMADMHTTMKNSFNGTGIDLSKCEKNFQKVKNHLEKVSPCPEWTDWSSWGSCSKSCGHAYKKRSRNYCIETDCIETEEDTRVCDIEGCEFYYFGYLFGNFYNEIIFRNLRIFLMAHKLIVGVTPWTSWSTCPDCCGKWESKRSRKCVDGHCSVTLEETQSKEQYPMCKFIF